MQELFYEGLTIYGQGTFEELSAFEEVEEGKMEGERDNLVIATGLAAIGLRNLEHLRFTAPIEESRVITQDPDYKFERTYEEIISNIQNRKTAKGLPFARQVAH